MVESEHQEEVSEEMLEERDNCIQALTLEIAIKDKIEAMAFNLVHAVEESPVSSTIFF